MRSINPSLCSFAAVCLNVIGAVFLLYVNGRYWPSSGFASASFSRCVFSFCMLFGLFLRFSHRIVVFWLLVFVGGVDWFHLLGLRGRLEMVLHIGI